MIMVSWHPNVIHVKVMSENRREYARAEVMAQWLHNAKVAEMLKTTEGKEVWKDMITNAEQHGTT